MDNDQIALTWLVSIIGALGVAVMALFLWIVKGSERKAGEKIDAYKRGSDDRIQAVEVAVSKWVAESKASSEQSDRKIEDLTKEMHRDQEVSRKNCQDLVAAITKQIADKELMALKTFAEKTEVNALRIEHGRTLERIHDKLDKMAEKFNGS